MEQESAIPVVLAILVHVVLLRNVNVHQDIVDPPVQSVSENHFYFFQLLTNVPITLINQ